MTLQEVFQELDLAGSYEEQCKQYAEILDTGSSPDAFSEELIGDIYSPNGTWNWSKKDSFICKYKNNVDFNEVLCIFENPLPDGVFIINTHFDYSSADERERIIARITEEKFVDIRVNFKNHRIFMAMEIPRKQVDREITQITIRTAVRQFKPFLDMYEAEEGEVVFSNTKCKVLPLLRIYKKYLDGTHDRESCYMSLVYGINLPLEEANWFLDEWKKDEIMAASYSYRARFWFKSDYSSIIHSEWYNEFSDYDIYCNDRSIQSSSFDSFSWRSLHSLPWGLIEIKNGKVIILVGDNCPDSAIEMVIKNYGLGRYRNVMEIHRKEHRNSW